MHTKQWVLLIGFALANVTPAPAYSQQSANDLVINAAAKSLQKLISDAIAAFEQTPRKAWAYKITRYENEEGDITSSIETYSPHTDALKRWSLLMKNGKRPSEKQAKEFREDKLEQASKTNHMSMKLRQLIDTKNLQLTAETPLIITASFPVTIPKLGDDTAEKLVGMLTYNKHEKFIERIEIANIESFSPMFSAKITDFKLAMTFLKIDNAILPLENQLSMKGTFAIFTTIEEESLDTFSDYQFVGED